MSIIYDNRIYMKLRMRVYVEFVWAFCARAILLWLSRVCVYGDKREEGCSFGEKRCVEVVPWSESFSLGSFSLVKSDLTCFKRSYRVERFIIAWRERFFARFWFFIQAEPKSSG